MTATASSYNGTTLVKVTALDTCGAGAVSTFNVNVVGADQRAARTNTYPTSNRDAGSHPDLSPSPTPGPGSVDTTFNVNVSGGFAYGISTAIQPDGKIIIAGDFTAVGAVTRTNIARLNPDGTLDMTFNPNADALVTSVAVQADGKIPCSEAASQPWAGWHAIISRGLIPTAPLTEALIPTRTARSTA